MDQIANVVNRALYDPMFQHLVQTLQGMIERGPFTADELRAALTLALMARDQKRLRQGREAREHDRPSGR